MAERRQGGLGDALFGTPMGRSPTSGPLRGEFVPPPEMPERDEPGDALPEQEEFWRAPVRFGSIPVEGHPLGWDSRRGFRKIYPQVMLPTQVVDRVSFGHPDLEPNRLFWGDNLHVMRQLPSESIDLIYIDPPFFSGKQYNVIFGDQNELRSFADIWEGGLPGYLIWLNARLYEMKRLLTRTGSIYVHCDWHASHYIKVELDKIFGHDDFLNEVVWQYSQGGKGRKLWAKKHDTLFFYSRSRDYYFDSSKVRVPLTPHKRSSTGSYGGRMGIDEQGREYVEKWGTGKKKLYRYYLDEGKIPEDVWEIQSIQAGASERIGYPTQKPEALLERVILASTRPNDTVGDFFVGGGTTAAVAQRLGRRWVACDQSRVAVAITSDRLALGAEQIPLAGERGPTPDFTVEHWGIYEARRLGETPPDQFRDFVSRAFGAVPDPGQEGFHGHKGAVPIWVGGPQQRSQVTAQDVEDFANAIRRTVRYQQDNLRDGIMLAWAFRPDAIQAGDQLRRMEITDLNFVRLDLLRIDSPRFREHVSTLSTDKADYSTFLTFVQPPRVEVGWRQLGGRLVKFDASETAVLNSGARIANVQWDFEYNGRFTSTQGYSFVRTAAKEPALQVDYTFPASGKHRIACKVQDDAGGEGIWSGELEV
ncbi:MAG TPA: site-specific DNA-methyltransferase [Dehalococcoidia bacterium]|nr:site-specific DNA-methyltransferase [Dehalococcoidia bacterium]